MTQPTPTTGASFNRGKSRQDFATPQDFRDAVVKRFGMPLLDLAATAEIKFGHGYISKETDSLTQSWVNCGGLTFLNPPFGNIAPWARKCAEESKLGARILFLVPASVGSNWFAEYVYDKAMVCFLRPRLCFDGIAPFPKDVILCAYNVVGTGFQCWRWR